MDQSISEFLKNLPSHNEKNFALFNTENGIRTSSRLSVYLPTVDIPSEQSKYAVYKCVYEGVRASVHAYMRLLSRFIYVACNTNRNIFVLNFCSHCHRKEKYFIEIFTSAMGQKGKKTYRCSNQLAAAINLSPFFVLHGPISKLISRIFMFINYRLQ